MGSIKEALVIVTPRKGAPHRGKMKANDTRRATEPTAICTPLLVLLEKKNHRPYLLLKLEHQSVPTAFVTA